MCETAAHRGKSWQQTKPPDSMLLGVALDM
jgi:hypothetical protein